ncbi:MAG: toll/interleukin-1 receptor domain-containing protein [Nevskiaceae bacterium]|jgi:hypothetical protein|nr:toll/interleukin-1 receptor domain-containing protein [Nevskiaceae bacterium]
MLKLRRLPTDPEPLLKKLDALEKLVGAGQMEPYLAVVVAEWFRITWERTGHFSPPPGDEYAKQIREMYLDKELVAIMRAQADGPWAIGIEQARGEAATAYVVDGLAALYSESSPVPEPATDAEDSVMTEPLFPEHKWDVAISYAGEDEAIVEPIARRLKLAGLRVFYARWDELQSYLWGKDLVVELPRIYGEEAAYCIVFVSEAYARSMWTRMELRNSLARALENDEYVKPIRLDDTKLPGLSPTVSYLDARPGHLYSDPSRLIPLMLDAIRYRGQFVPKPAVPKANSPDLSIEEYFGVVLPAMLRWEGEAATNVGGTVLFDVTGADAGVWLIRLCPPEATVKRITANDDINALQLPRHLEITITPTEMANMLAGKFDARKALIEGNVEIKGDLALLKEVGTIFQRRMPSPA